MENGFGTLHGRKSIYSIYILVLQSGMKTVGASWKKNAEPFISFIGRINACSLTPFFRPPPLPPEPDLVVSDTFSITFFTFFMSVLYPFYTSNLTQLLSLFHTINLSTFSLFHVYTKLWRIIDSDPFIRIIEISNFSTFPIIRHKRVSDTNPIDNKWQSERQSGSTFFTFVQIRITIGNNVTRDQNFNRFIPSIRINLWTKFSLFPCFFFWC